MHLTRWLVVGAVILYLVSLGLPAVRGSGFPAQNGLDLLRQGAGAWDNGVVAWYANPAFWIAIALTWFGCNRLALGIASFGLMLGLSSYTAAAMAERAGRSVPEFDYAIGFYVWLAALVLLVASALYGIYKVSAPEPGQNRGPAGPARD